MNYDFADLFDKRSVVGAKLEDLLVERSFTKAAFCKECGISRPTLDKLLAGNITSMANFEKHMQKILSVLSVTPDFLLGNVKNVYSRVREIRNILNIKQEMIAQSTSISSDRLREIEAGDDATIAELREIALFLRTGTHCVNNTYVFYPQMSVKDDYLTDSGNTASRLSGFWGHMGILPKNSNEYFWYPITHYHAVFVRENMDNDRMVVPCMNNKVLYLNMNQIDSVVLLNDDCDPPAFANWDPSVGEGEIPLVVYEALDDYVTYEDDMPEYLMSPVFMNYLKGIIEKYDWTEESIFDLTSKITIRFVDGKTANYCPDYASDDFLVEAIRGVYLFGREESEKFLGFTDDEVEIMINTDNISMIEMPLHKVEDAIVQGYQEMMSE